MIPAASPQPVWLIVLGFGAIAGLAGISVNEFLNERKERLTEEEILQPVRARMTRKPSEVKKMDVVRRWLRQQSNK